MRALIRWWTTPQEMSLFWPILGAPLIGITGAILLGKALGRW